MKTDIYLIKGDITDQSTDAIVNAANNSLLGGGGVDGAIHRAAGPGLLAECKTLGGCATGDAVITSGYNLKARFVIHTVGPVWQGGQSNEDVLLRHAYYNSLKLADEKGLKTIAFPSISTGAYGFPVERAAFAALSTVKNYLMGETTNLEKVVFVLFNDKTYDAFDKALMAMHD